MTLVLQWNVHCLGFFILQVLNGAGQCRDILVQYCRLMFLILATTAATATTTDTPSTTILATAATTFPDADPGYYDNKDDTADEDIWPPAQDHLLVHPLFLCLGNRGMLLLRCR